MKIKFLLLAGAAALVSSGGTTLVRSAMALGSDEAGMGSSSSDMGSSKSGSQSGMSTTMTKERATTAEAGDIRQLRLKVLKVDKDNHKVNFEAQISPEAKIQENGHAIKLDQLHEGDEARVSFVPGSNQITKLQVTRTGEKQKDEMKDEKSEKKSGEMKK